MGHTIVVGTAGHVDHGKSALVRALTGTDPDRLAEEKARGLTIDLGFAWCELPGGTVASFIDVPGHEDFIRNMLAGAGGVTAALLVIAADEGPMPQTREHLQILDLLRVRSGLVALTKADLVTDSEWLELVKLEVAGLLAGTSLAEAPIVPVSSTTGAGLAELVAALEAVLAGAPPPMDRGLPRLAIDRVFTLPGFGTIATGTLRDGALVVGDNLELLPGGLRTRARTLHSHGRAVESAPPGTRVAVNVTGLDVAHLDRGDVLARPGDYVPSRMLDATVELLQEAPPLAHDDEVLVFHGSTAIPARVRLIGQRALGPGEVGRAQLVLARPIAAAAGDRFVVRRPSPGVTIGGGQVLDPTPRRRRPRFRDSSIARLAALQSGEPVEIVWHALAELEPCPATALTRVKTGVDGQARDSALETLLEAGRAARLGDLWITDSRLRTLRSRAQAYLERYHRRLPLRPGTPREELRERLSLGSEAYSRWLQAATSEGWLAVDGDTVRLRTHGIELAPDQAAAVRAMLDRFRSAPYSPPSVDDTAAALGPELLGLLLQRGDLVQLDLDVLLDRQAYAEMRQAVVDKLSAAGEITVAELRDTFGTSRKYALSLLEHLDRERVTRRVGDSRVAGPRAPAGGGG
jgi:selenocysteine-specific elongation factor